MSKDDKRTAILQATMELVAEKGFHDAPCSLIAERAGVAAGTIYRYFANKDVLINELYCELEARINASILIGYTTEMPFRERFIHLVSHLLRFFISNPCEFKYIEQFHNSPYGEAFRRDRMLDQAEDEGSGIYCELFRQGTAQQVLKDLPLPLQFDLAFGPTVFAARNHVLGFLKLDDEMISRFSEACWDSIRR